MMQRVLHISSEYAHELSVFHDRFTIENTCKRGNILSVIVSYDSFSDFSSTIYEFILKTGAKKYIYRQLYNELKYFNSQEQNIMYSDICRDISKDRYIGIINVIVASRSIINTDGVFFFSLRSMRDEIKELCIEKANEYILRNEYLDFIRMLRFFASVNYGSVQKLHVIIKSEYSADILDEDYNEYNNVKSANFEIAYLNEIVEYDTLVSILVEVSPKEIVVHNWKKYKDCEMLETLINIFDDRIICCEGCFLCAE